MIILVMAGVIFTIFAFLIMRKERKPNGHVVFISIVLMSLIILVISGAVYLPAKNDAARGFLIGANFFMCAAGIIYCFVYFRVGRTDAVKNILTKVVLMVGSILLSVTVCSFSIVFLTVMF